MFRMRKPFHRSAKPASIQAELGIAFCACLLPLIPLQTSFAQDHPAGSAKSSTTYLENGIHLLQSQDAAAARLQFTRAIANDPRSADAFIWRGIAENQLSLYGVAAKDFQAALRIKPGAVSAEYNLALSFIHLSEFDPAIRALRQVLAARPGVFEPEYNLALLLERKHETAEAVEHLQAAHQARPGDASVIRHLTHDLLVLGRTEEAESLLREAPTAAPAEALQEMSDALLKEGHFREAIPYLESLRAQQPDAQTDLMLARAYIGASADAKAIEILRPHQSDSDGEAAWLIGLAEFDAGATEEAQAAFAQAVRLNPRNAHALYHLGILESANAQTLPQATDHLQQALQLEPGNADYGIALGKALLEQNDARRAMAVLTHSQATGSRAGERDLLLGIAAIIVDGPARAIPELQSAIAAAPSLALSHDMLGFCYFFQGDMSRSAESYARASDLSPATLIFAHGAAVAFDHANNPQRALVYATRAAALPAAGASDHELLGKLLSRMGRQQDAITQLTQAISIDPNSERAYFLLGRTYMQSGDRAQAKLWADRLKELKSSHGGNSVVSGESLTPLTSSTLLHGAPVAPESQQ